MRRFRVVGLLACRRCLCVLDGHFEYSLGSGETGCVTRGNIKVKENAAYKSCMTDSSHGQGRRKTAITQYLGRTDGSICQAHYIPRWITVTSWYFLFTQSWVPTTRLSLFQAPINSTFRTPNTPLSTKQSVYSPQRVRSLGQIQLRQSQSKSRKSAATNVIAGK